MLPSYGVHGCTVEHVYVINHVIQIMARSIAIEHQTTYNLTEEDVKKGIARVFIGNVTQDKFATKHNK